MASRKVEDLVPPLQILFREFRAIADFSGVQFLVTCTYRSQKEQDELYAQGRTKPGKKVTWTRNSRHTKGEAFDIAVLDKNHKITWDLKADVDEDQHPDYFELGELGESIGLEWGGRWESPDYPHFQLKNT